LFQLNAAGLLYLYRIDFFANCIWAIYFLCLCSSLSSCYARSTPTPDRQTGRQTSQAHHRM